jgi:pyruvate dehydrogenase E2 component (dihydrolipoamide acetyltransferase)
MPTFLHESLNHFIV